MLTKSDIKIGNAIAANLGACVGGSYLVHGENANDFDIFMSLSAFQNARLGYSEFTVNTFAEGGQKITFVDTWNDRSEYYQTNNTDDALYMTFRSTCNRYNMIVINDDFVLAFKISANVMTAHPEKYQTKEQRVELHHAWRQVIRHLLSDSFAASEDTTPTKF